MSTERAKSAGRALVVLQELARAGTAMSAHELADACAIPRSSVYQLLGVMREHRFVDYQSAERSWSLGVGVLELGSAYLRSGGLQQRSRPHLVRLTTATGHTSHLAVLDGPEVVYLAKREPTGGGIRLVTEVGTRLPAHATAVGKAILAHLAPRELAIMYGPDVVGDALEPVRLHDLVRELHAVRRNGYAEDHGQITPGISCVASPVQAADGRVLASVGVSYVSATQDEKKHAATVAEVRKTAAELSRAFAHVAEPGPELTARLR